MDCCFNMGKFCENQTQSRYGDESLNLRILSPDAITAIRYEFCRVNKRIL